LPPTPLRRVEDRPVAEARRLRLLRDVCGPRTPPLRARKAHLIRRTSRPPPVLRAPWLRNVRVVRCGRGEVCGASCVIEARTPRSPTERLCQKPLVTAPPTTERRTTPTAERRTTPTTERRTGGVGGGG
jgi:hypothetical protein